MQAIHGRTCMLQHDALLWLWQSACWLRYLCKCEVWCTLRRRSLLRACKPFVVLPFAHVYRRVRIRAAADPIFFAFVVGSNVRGALVGTVETVSVHHPCQIHERNRNFANYWCAARGAFTKDYCRLPTQHIRHTYVCLNKLTTRKQTYSRPANS